MLGHHPHPPAPSTHQQSKHVRARLYNSSGFRNSFVSPAIALLQQLAHAGLTPLVHAHNLAVACRRSARLMATAQQQPNASNAALPKVVIITGPTAVGKTAVGLLLSERIGGEVVSADSVQVYRGLDIGSDKLPLAERRGIAHHLLDVRDLHEEYSAGDFHDEARAAIRNILQRGKTPIVVGGTGFYLRLMMEGKTSTSRATPEQEQEVEQMVQDAWQAAAQAAGVSDVDQLTPEQRWDAAAELLAQFGDTEAHERIAAERNNYYRLKRALHVLRSNPGKTMREVDVGTRGAETGAEEQEQAQEQYDWRTFFLYRPRQVLHDKVDTRLQEMVLSGLLDEATSILLAGVEPGSSMPSRAVGYRQAMTWLLQAALEVEEQGQVKGSMTELVARISGATSRLIRQQMNWFRERDEYRWLNMDELSSEAATQLIQDALQAEVHEGQVIPSRGRVAEEELSSLKTRRVKQDVFAARPQDVQAVLHHVQHDLVPRILAAPQTQTMLAAARQQLAAEREQAAKQAAEKLAKKQRKLEIKQQHMQKAMESKKEQQHEGAGGPDGIVDQSAGDVAESEPQQMAT